MNTAYDVRAFFRCIGFMAGHLGSLLVFIGCIWVHEWWTGWSLDRLKDIWPGAALVILGVGVIVSPILAAWALGL